MEENFQIKNQDKTSEEELCKIEISNLPNEVFNDRKDVQQTRGGWGLDDHKYFFILTIGYYFVFTSYSLA